MENGKEFKLECRSNRAGRFIFYMVKSVEGKSFTLCFPEGRGIPGGWFVLVEKLHSSGVGFSGLVRLTLGSVFPSVVDSGDVLKKVATVSYAKATN